MDHKSINSEVIEILKQIPIDLRLEVVITDILKSGYSLDDFFIQPIGIFKRRFGKDISGVKRTDLNDNTEIYKIAINREGLYDMLPQGLFHNPPGKGTKAFKTASEMSEEVRVSRKQEAEAREFFHIYEMEMYQQRLSVEWYERNILETITITMDDEAFLSYWQLPKVFNKTQKGVLFYLYPIINKIRGNIKLMEKTYSLILKADVKLSKEYEHVNSVDEFEGYNQIGKHRLGLDFIMGTKTSSVYESLHIQVGPIPNSEVVHYLEGGNMWKVLTELNKFLMPAYMNFVLSVQNIKEVWNLGHEKTGSRLGWNVSI